MADILGTFYQAKKVRIGTSPSSPGVISGEPVTPVNPQGSNPSHSPVTIGTANGLSLSGQELSLGLASSGVTGALSGADWDTFNGKIGGTIESGQVAFGTGAGAIGGSSKFIYDSTTNIISLSGGHQINSNGILTFNNNAGGIVRGINLTQNIRAYSAALIGVFLNNSSSGRIQFSGGNSTANGGNFTLYGGDIENAVQFRVGLTTHMYMVSGNTAIGNLTSPTNTLDVNGTARVRNINNLGTSATEVLVPDATGVVHKRTVGELVSDMGVISTIDTNAVHYDDDDGKTASEKDQARQNIGSVDSFSGRANQVVIISPDESKMDTEGAEVLDLSGIVGKKVFTALEDTFPSMSGRANEVIVVNNSENELDSEPTTELGITEVAGSATNNAMLEITYLGETYRINVQKV